MKKLRVNLGENSYDILIEQGLLAKVGQLIDCQGKKVFVITDSNVDKLYGKIVCDSLKASDYKVEKIVLPAGEKTKSFDTLPLIYEKMLDFGLTRKDLVITLGGGVIGDLGGFASATYQRGVAFVQIPTTLLAQVDSSVGGKVAVDLPQGKNLVGCFYQPKMVIIDPNLLQTLSQEIFSDGMGEVIKYGCIKDEKLFDKLSSYTYHNEIMQDIEDIVAICCDIKRQVVENDEKDLGERMLLNFGHTYGHALEKYYEYETLTHGQAIAIGMVYICKIAEKLKLTTSGVADRIAKVLTKFNLPISDSALPKDVVGGVANDKKNLGNKLNLALLKDIGQSYVYSAEKDFFVKYEI